FLQTNFAVRLYQFFAKHSSSPLVRTRRRVISTHGHGDEPSRWLGAGEAIHPATVPHRCWKSAGLVPTLALPPIFILRGPPDAAMSDCRDSPLERDQRPYACSDRETKSG